jgi:phosphocarrier protein NPr
MQIEKELTIVNRLGLHARAATQLVQLVNQYNADITLFQGKKSANANSVLGLLMLESSQGKKVRVVVSGDQAEQAMAAVELLISQGFHEQD